MKKEERLILKSVLEEVESRMFESESGWICDWESIMIEMTDEEYEIFKKAVDKF